jgi:hypothetical protein
MVNRPPLIRSETDDNDPSAAPGAMAAWILAVARLDGTTGDINHLLIHLQESR